MDNVVRPGVGIPTLWEDLNTTTHSLLRLLKFLITWCISISSQIVAFATLSLPRYLYSVLYWGTTFTLQLNFTRLFVLLIIGGTILSYIWKVRYLNRYTTLKEAPLTPDEGFDLHPDLATDQSGPGFHNYLDEFLSAIKVFGYLEKPVFHELARHLQTRRLVAGDTLNLDQDKSFYIVIDGSVQVYAQTGSPSKARDAYDDEDNNGYQLLNNVQSGGTLSSLFTILSLFTEDVKLRYDETGAAPMSRRSTTVPSHSRERDTDVSDFTLDDLNRGAHARSPSSSSHAFNFTTPSRRASQQRSYSPPPPRSSHSRRSDSPNPPRTRPLSTASFASSISTATRSASDSQSDSATEIDPGSPRPASPKLSSHVPPLDPIVSAPGTPGFGGLGSNMDEGRPRRSRDPSVMEGMGSREGTIARATVDTTLAVIPAEAFRRLTKKFPNAAAHIVQVILTRLQRVTFLTAHKYLGLTREVIRTEKAINELACYPLPEAFWESGGIQRLRARFMPETRMVPEEEREDYFAFDTPYAGPKMGQAFWGKDAEPAADEGVKLKMRPLASRGSTRNAGDILSMARPDEDRLGHVSFSPIATPRPAAPIAAFANDFDLRDAVMECISKAIGLSQQATTPAHSVDASPMVKPQDEFLQKAVFNSSFGSLSFLGLQGFDDESSMTGSSVASFSSTELENEVEILYFEQGSLLVKEGEKNAGLYFVIEGFLDVSMPEDSTAASIKPHKTSTAPPTNIPPTSSASASASARGSRRQSTQESATQSFRIPPRRPPRMDHINSPKSARSPLNSRFPLPRTSSPEPLPSQVPPPSTSTSIPLFTVKPGGIAGYLSSLSGFPSYVNITAKTECYVGFLPAKALERIMDRRPIVLLTLAKRLISLLSPLVLHIDSALDWMHVSAGQVIYRQGDPSDSFYIVINGRLRSINEKTGGGVQVQGEYGQGESVGELDCITASTRPTTLHAIRDTELARMPMTLFNAISVRHPLVTVQISRIIAARVRQQMEDKPSIPSSITVSGSNELGKNNFNLKTVAILPTNRHVPVTDFALKLFQALESIGAPTSYLNQATVMQVLGRHAFSKMGTLKLAGWLAETEQKYRIVLYVVDTAISAPWTQTCIRQADAIFVVADAGTEPTLGEYEKLLIGMKTTARKELVLLHTERNVIPGSTRPWLKNRPWIHAHHHVEMEGATPAVTRESEDLAPVIALRKLAKRVEIEIGKYKKAVPRPQPTRAPALTDFARLARRLCGKSIGIVLGGGGARGISHIGVLQALAEQGVPVDLVGGTSIGSFVGGLYARDGDLVSTFGRAKRFSGRMSTLWRILTDLTYPVVAYTTGHEFNRGIYKSFYDVHIEDMWLPFFCNTTNITHSRMDVHTTGYAWRYVRASMSLAGLLPPLCDRGDMLVDGGYVDNLPVSVMLAMGASSVFAVDVGSVDDTNPRNYGESVSGWWLLVQRWNPFGKPSNIPNITEIQSRLTYVSSVKMLEDAKATPGVLYMRMPVTNFGTMEFKRFEEILTIGYNTAKEMIADFVKSGKLPTGTEGDISAEKIRKRGQSARRNSI
ncbi:patatin-domain-containing protein [Meredithblackwellia eburnea MCA 4105]